MRDEFGVILELKEDSRRNRTIRFFIIILALEIFIFLWKIGAEYLECNKYMGMITAFLLPFAIFVGKKLQYNFDYGKVMKILFVIFLPIMIVVGIGGLGIISLLFWIAIPIITLTLYLCIIIVGAIILAPIAIIYLIYWAFFERIEIKDNKEKKTNVIVNKALHNNFNTNIINDFEKKDDILSIGIDEDEYYCENCLKKISEEEWELNDCMCEECMTELIFHEIEDSKDKRD